MKPNKATQQASSLCQVLNTLPKGDYKESNNKLIAKLIARLVANFEAKVFNIDDINLFGDLIITNINKS